MSHTLAYVFHALDGWYVMSNKLSHDHPKNTYEKMLITAYCTPNVDIGVGQSVFRFTGACVKVASSRPVDRASQLCPIF